MATNDPIADMLTRIRNATAVRKPRVRVKRSKVCLGIARVLQEEGYIKGFLSIDDASGQGEIEIDLKYGETGEPLGQPPAPGCGRDSARVRRHGHRGGFNGPRRAVGPAVPEDARGRRSALHDLVKICRV